MINSKYRNNQLLLRKNNNSFRNMLLTTVIYSKMYGKPFRNNSVSPFSLKEEANNPLSCAKSRQVLAKWH